MAFQLTPTSPASTYRPTYGVTYGGQAQPTSGVPMTPTSRAPIPSLLNPPRPAMPPPRPAGVPTQMPAMGGALSGANGLAGAPGGPYAAMPGGFSGTAPGLQPGSSGALPRMAPAAGGGLLGPPREAPYQMGLPGRLGPIDMTYAGPALSLGGLAVPGLGLLGVAANAYNTVASDQIAGSLGGYLDFGQWLGGLLGLNDYGQGRYTGAPMNLADPSGWIRTPNATPANPQWQQQAVRDASARGGSGDYARENRAMFGSDTGGGTGALY